MGNAKIEIQLGKFSFSGEGEETWLEKQLEKILERAPEIMKITNEMEESNEQNNDSLGTQNNKKDIPNLSTFLQQKNATKNQLRKFLATAVWLHERGASRITTTDVTRALKDNQQTRLSNPSDCLNKNVAKGFCEKDGNQFFVTDEGRKSL